MLGNVQPNSSLQYCMHLHVRKLLTRGCNTAASSTISEDGMLACMRKKTILPGM